MRRLLWQSFQMRVKRGISILRIGKTTGITSEKELDRPMALS
jgi:hypothetical protein